MPKYVHLPSVVYWYSRHLCSLNCWGSIGQRRFVRQVWCSGIQGISTQVLGGIQKPKKVCLPNMNSLLNLLLLHRGLFILHMKDQTVASVLVIWVCCI